MSGLLQENFTSVKQAAGFGPEAVVFCPLVYMTSDIFLILTVHDLKISNAWCAGQK